MDIKRLDIGMGMLLLFSAMDDTKNFKYNSKKIFINNDEFSFSTSNDILIFKKNNSTMMRQIHETWQNDIVLGTYDRWI